MRYLLDAWYAAAHSAEVGVALLARTLLDRPMLLFRTQAGDPVALVDQCPHRLAPLSMGKRRGDIVECLYHGLQFDRSGKCVANPHGDGVISRKAMVRSFPIVERYGFLWFWPGAPERADAALIPRFDFLDDTGNFATVGGYLHVAANYELIVDNLLDLSHVEFLHPMFARARGLETTRTELIQNGDSVTYNRWKPNVPHNGLTQMFWTSGTTHGDARANMTWHAPSLLAFDLGTKEVGSAEAGLCLPAAHLITPETPTRSHYFWAQSRNWQRDDAELGEKLRSITDKTFLTEDKPVVEAQQRRMGDNGDLMAFDPIMLDIDAPALRARRILKRLIDNEDDRGTKTERPARAGAA